MVSNDNVSMALFCDFENVALGVRDANYEKFDIRPVLERLLLKGSIVVKKAYCDWERYKGFKASMHEANFELIEIPHVRQSGKNSADIRLVVDALDLCYTKSHVDTFVIISGDSDFSPLVSKLRENAKHVIGVGVKQSTSDLLIANCDEFIFYDDLVRESQRTAARRDNREAQPSPRRTPDDERRRKEEAEARKTKALVIASETFEALMAERGDSGKIWASVLKEAIKRRKPDFNESYYGFRAFGNLLEEAQARGLMEFGRDEKSGAYVYRANLPEGAEAAANGAGGAAQTGPVAGAAAERGGAAPSSRRGGRRDGRRSGQAPAPAMAQDEVNRADDALFEDDAPPDSDMHADAARAPSQRDMEWDPRGHGTRGSRRTVDNPFDSEQEDLPLGMPEQTDAADASQQDRAEHAAHASAEGSAADADDAAPPAAKTRRGSRGRAAKKAVGGSASPAEDAAGAARQADDAAPAATREDGAARPADIAAAQTPAAAGNVAKRAPRRGRRTTTQAEPQFEAVVQAEAAAQGADSAAAPPPSDAGEAEASAPRKSAARKTAARGRRPRKTATAKE